MLVFRLQYLRFISGRAAMWVKSWEHQIGQPTCKSHQAPFQVISHHMMRALTPYDTSAHTI